MRFRTWQFFIIDTFLNLRKALPRYHLQPSTFLVCTPYTLRIQSYLFKGSPKLQIGFCAFIPKCSSSQLCRLNEVRSFTTSLKLLLWPLLTSHDKLYSIMVLRRNYLHHVSVRPPRISVLTFHLMSASFTPTAPNSYGTLTCLAVSSAVICLIWSFSWSDQMFPASFLQIPPHDGHPCYWLYDSRY